MELGAPELLLILLIVILLFGVGRIGKIAGELGSGIKAFKDGLRGDDLKLEPVRSMNRSKFLNRKINSFLLRTSPIQVFSARSGS